MRFSWRLGVAGLVGVCFIYVAAGVRTSAQAQLNISTEGKTAGQAFKNVTTNLKDLSVDDFLGAMGVISADLGFDCADCHPNAGTDKVDWVIDTQRKRMARRMIDMVAAINRTHFGGGQRVTCWTCHHARDIPASTIELENLYSTPNSEKDDIIRTDDSEPAATEILDQYIAAVGGAQRWASVNSLVISGASLGFGGFGGNGEFSIYAKKPNQRTQLIRFREHPERGESTWAFDGTAGWIKSPRGLLSEFNLVGGELDGARFDAQTVFPDQIKSSLTGWRVGSRQPIGDKDYQVVQGTGPRNFLVTLYFDPDTHLLVRLVRYSPSPVGRMPTQLDFSDYRDVNGLKFPFEYRFMWLDGRFTAKINDVKTNVAIDPALFGKPSSRR